MTGDLLTQRLDSILSLLEGSVRQAGQFAVDQAPDLVQQLLAWSLIRSIILSLAFITLSVATALVAPRLWRIGMRRKSESEYGTAGDGWFALCFILVGSSCLSFAMFIGGVLNCVQILIAPKVWLLEYAASFLNHP